MKFDCRHFNILKPQADLFRFLVENRGHGQDGTALLQGRGEALPVLIQLCRDLLDLIGSVVTCLAQPRGHRGDPCDVYVSVLDKI